MFYQSSVLQILVLKRFVPAKCLAIFFADERLKPPYLILYSSLHKTTLRSLIISIIADGF